MYSGPFESYELELSLQLSFSFVGKQVILIAKIPT